MNILKIFCAFFVFEFFGDSVKCANWVDHLTKYIVKDSGVRQVQLVTNLAENETSTSPLIDVICSKLLEKIPVLVVRAPKYDTLNHPPDTNTVSTLFLFDYESPNKSSVSEVRQFIHAATRTNDLYYEPKYLMLFVGTVRNKIFKKLLESCWKNMSMDLTIVEWIEPKQLQILRSERYRSHLPIIHQFNPFKKEYTNRTWTGRNFPLFPDHFSNLWGYRLRIRTVDLDPFSIGKFNEKNEPIEVGGANIVLIQTIAGAMNATLEYVPSIFTLPRSHFTNEYDYYYYNAALQKANLVSSLVAISSGSSYVSLRTAPIIYDPFCAVVPIQNEDLGANFSHLIAAYCLSIITVLIYLVLSRVLRFPARVWGPFYVARLFFGVSVSQRPRKNVERVIFASLLAISAMYSSSVYTAMTDVSLGSTKTKEFRSIEDLDRSGLNPIIDPINFNKTFFQAKGSLLNLLKKTNVTENSSGLMNCAKRAARKKDVLCLMPKSTATVALTRNNRHGPDKIKISKACLWSDSFVFMIGGKSPYRSKIDERIRSLNEVGLISRFYNKENMESSKSPKSLEEEIAIEEEENKTVMYQHLLAVSIVGYSISLLVFFIELILGRILKYRKSKVQPFYFPYTD